MKSTITACYRSWIKNEAGMAIDILEARSVTELQEFMDFPYALLKDSPYWVPPLRGEQWDWIYHRKTPLLRNHPHAFFVARSGEKIVGRVAVVEDQTLNQRQNLKDASFAFIDFINDRNVLEALVERCTNWAQERQLDRLVGPVSPTKGDDYRGMLTWGGFEAQPVIMNVWNPRYYVDLMEALGFVEHYDLVAYYYDLRTLDLERKYRVMEKARKRYGFRVDPFNKSSVEAEARDIRSIIERALPDWFEMVTPPLEDIIEMAERLKRFADPHLIGIARTADGEPIGFNLALPDYNAVFKHLNGRLGLIGKLKFLWYRREIKGARSFVMFVVPEWRKKGVAHALYLTAFRHAMSKGYVYGEGSTIGKINLPMRRDAESVGGVHYRSYRIWERAV